MWWQVFVLALLSNPCIYRSIIETNVKQKILNYGKSTCCIEGKVKVGKLPIGQYHMYTGLHLEGSKNVKRE
jgi:hypothetical protein